jgi:predicted DNA-binding transcriptional regulator AlpA
VVREELVKLLPDFLPSQAEEYLTTKQVADLTGLSVSFFEVGRSMSSPNQPSHRKVGRRILYRRSDIESWLEARKRS